MFIGLPYCLLLNVAIGLPHISHDFGGVGDLEKYTITQHNLGFFKSMPVISLFHGQRYFNRTFWVRAIK